MIKFDIITIFPDIFDSYFNESIIKRAQNKGLIKINIHDLRDYTVDKHKTVDDSPYGGGPGMVMMVEPIYKAVKKIGKNKKSKVILFSAKGKKFDQKMAKRFSKLNNLIMICGRYEGVDERVAKKIADEEISIGDYVLTGGEIPAMIVVDAVSRLIPGVLGKKESLEELKGSYPAYTRPEEFNKWQVPKILLSGDHKKIKEWRKRYKT
jgi:tRNA (guanine37-N1)-methyltransferase